MMTLTSIVMIAVAAVAGTAETGQADDVDRLLALARSEQAKVDIDPYASVPNHADSIGKSFRKVLAPNVGSLSVGYHEGIFSVELHPLALRAGGDLVDGLTIRVENKGQHAATGQTIGGAKVSYVEARVQQESLAVIKAPPTLGPLYEGYRFSKSLDSAQAKALANALRVQVDGNIAALSNNRVSGCVNEEIPATLNLRANIKSRNCYVSITISRVAFIDIRSGEILKVWE